MWPSPCIRRLGVDVLGIYRGSEEVQPQMRKFLTSDLDMTHTLFVGTAPPRKDMLSGKPRWIGHDRCRMVLASVCEPGLFAMVFGIHLDAMDCVELDAATFRKIQRESVYPAPVPVTQPAGLGLPPGVRPAFSGSQHVADTFGTFGALQAGDWFLMPGPDGSKEVPCSKLDEGMCVMYANQDALLMEVDPGVPVTPIIPDLKWRFPNGAA